MYHKVITARVLLYFAPLLLSPFLSNHYVDVKIFCFQVSKSLNFTVQKLDKTAFLEC